MQNIMCPYTGMSVSVCTRMIMSDSVTSWTVARQTLLSMKFSRQEHWSGWHFLLQYTCIFTYFIYYYFTPPILPFQSIPTGFFLAFFLFHNGIFLVHCVKNDFQQHPGSPHQHIYLLLSLIIKLILCENHFAYTVDKCTTKSWGFVWSFLLTPSSCPGLRVVRYYKWFGLVLFLSLFNCVYSSHLKYNFKSLIYFCPRFFSAFTICIVFIFYLKKTNMPPKIKTIPENFKNIYPLTLGYTQNSIALLTPSTPFFPPHPLWIISFIIFQLVLLWFSW